MNTKDTESQTLDEWRPNYKRKCLVCGREGTVQGVKNNKVVYRGDMCGVCTWGEARLADPDEWNKQ